MYGEGQENTRTAVLVCGEDVAPLLEVDNIIPPEHIYCVGLSLCIFFNNARLVHFWPDMSLEEILNTLHS